MQRNIALDVLSLMANETAAQQNMFILYNVIDADDDEDEITDIMVAFTNHQHIRIDGYFEEWLPRYLDCDFFSLYRMSKNTFYTLLGALNCREKAYVGGEHQPILMEKALLMTLSWLGKGETLIRISEIFNVAICTVYNCTEYMLRQILALKHKIIVWPDEREVIQIEQNFRARAGFPGVIGAIDVCNIKFKAPANQQDSYTDKNNNHSIKLQGTVTSDKIFTNIMVGYPGSAHDSRVFRNSQLFLEVEENENFRNYFCQDDYHLVGDKAYPLKNWIMTPYRANINITNQQRRYNTKHSVTRIVVEHTFGLLKSRWRKLLYVNVNSIQKAVAIIVACCVLHNYCFMNFDYWNEYEEVENDNDAHENAADIQVDAIMKRNNIMNLF